MSVRWLWFVTLPLSGALASACLDLEAAEPSPGSGGAGGGASGGAAGWPSSGGASTGGSSTGGASTGGTSTGGASTGGAGGVGGAPAFKALGVVFDGVHDWLENLTGFQGVIDTQTVAGSFWLKRAGLGKVHCLGPEGQGSGSPNQLELTDTDSLRVVWRKAGGGVACDLTSGPITDTTSWHHIAFSVDTSDSSRRHLYLDGVLSMSTASFNNTLLDHTASSWGLFADDSGLLKYEGMVAELWLHMGVYLDLSQPNNLSKFRSSNGKPVDLGSNGAIPTGSPPTVYLSVRPGDTGAAFAQNRGTGGALLLHGTLDLPATSPSD